jgi:hypothetical protein
MKQSQSDKRASFKHHLVVVNDVDGSWIIIDGDRDELERYEVPEGHTAYILRDRRNGQ